MDENVKRMRETFEKIDVPHLIYYAHKPNKSSVFVKQALKNNIGIDVASRNELISALSAGYQGKYISCTGTKNQAFLYLAVQQETLISIDNLTELSAIATIQQKLGKTATRVLIRVANPTPTDRSLRVKTSRFGLCATELADAYQFIIKNHLQLIGFHFHNDERAPDIKREFITHMIDCIAEAYTYSLSPSIIDIGGGLRSNQLANMNEWKQFINDLSEALVNNKHTDTWRSHSFGMYINEKGKISGREKIEGKFLQSDFNDVLTEIFTTEHHSGRSLAEMVKESFLTIMVEPGFALLQQCGISLFEVVACKQSVSGELMIILDGNMYNLSTQMTEPLLDPILIQRQTPAIEQTSSGYLIGNLCREEDVLIKRAVHLTAEPKPGDLICFINTAAYTSDFEDAQPHQHERGIKLVAQKETSGWHLIAEDVYHPYS